MIGARCMTCGWGRRQEASGGDGPPDVALAHISLYPEHRVTWPASGAEVLDPISEHEQALARAYRAGWAAASKVLTERAQLVLRSALEGLT
jgi:hypothetical protein